LANLVLLCRHHHRVVHAAHWRIDHDGHGRFAFTHPQADQPLEHSPALPGAPAGAAPGHDPNRRTAALKPPQYWGDPAEDSWVVHVVLEELARAQPPPPPATLVAA